MKFKIQIVNANVILHWRWSHLPFQSVFLKTSAVVSCFSDQNSAHVLKKLNFYDHRKQVPKKFSVFDKNSENVSDKSRWKWNFQRLLKDSDQNSIQKCKWRHLKIWPLTYVFCKFSLKFILYSTFFSAAAFLVRILLTFLIFFVIYFSDQNDHWLPSSF